MPPVGFEPAIPASEMPQTHASYCAATGIGNNLLTLLKIEAHLKNHSTLFPYINYILI
jgi:hypothetical protein